MATGYDYGLKVFIKILILICCGFASGCISPSIQPAESNTLTQSTTRETASGFHGAIVARDYPSMLAYMEPSERKDYEQYLQICRNFDEKVDATANTIEKKIGALEAGEFRRKNQATTSPLQYAADASEIDWSKVNIRVDDDTASVHVEGIWGSRLEMIRGMDRWYATTDYDGGPPSADHMDETRRIMAHYARGIDIFRWKVLMGTINRDNFKERLNGQSD